MKAMKSLALGLFSLSLCAQAQVTGLRVEGTAAEAVFVLYKNRGASHYFDIANLRCQREAAGEGIRYACDIKNVRDVIATDKSVKFAGAGAATILKLLTDGGERSKNLRCESVDKSAECTLTF